MVEQVVLNAGFKRMPVILPGGCQPHGEKLEKCVTYRQP